MCGAKGGDLSDVQPTVALGRYGRSCLPFARAVYLLGCVLSTLTELLLHSLWSLEPEVISLALCLAVQIVFTMIPLRFGLSAHSIPRSMLRQWWLLVVLFEYRMLTLRSIGIEIRGPDDFDIAALDCAGTGCLNLLDLDQSIIMRGIQDEEKVGGFLEPA